MKNHPCFRAGGLLVVLLAIVCLSASDLGIARSDEAPRQLALDRPGRMLILDPDALETAPRVRLLDEGPTSLRLEMRLPALELVAVEGPDGPYHRLAIEGGGLAPADGDGAVPTVTRLVAVPLNGTPRAEVLASENRPLEGSYRLLPVQPVQDREEPAAGPVLPAASARRLAPRDPAPYVTIGQPTVWRDLNVVPVTFHPVRYDPASGAVEAATRLEVAIELGGPNPGLDITSAMPVPDRPIPESFDHLYRQVVVNYDGGPVLDRPGSYLIITPDNVLVEEELIPFLDWRRRQGYNVVTANTTQTGNTPEQIRTFLSGQFGTLHPPLEFVCLVGDANGSYAVPTWREDLSGFQGEGDHYYTNIGPFSPFPGLSDIHVGRLSFRSIGELQGIIDKILTYESAPDDYGDPGWFTRGNVVGDPTSSGITTVFVNQWVKSMLLDLGYTEVDTTWAPPFASQMFAKLNRGDSVFGYRGFYGVSGFTVSYVNALTNGNKCPFSVVITCDTGSFATYTTALTESFLRKAPGGAIACIGTATPGTHTRYNNCIYNGIMEGLLHSGDFRAGPALSRGKVEMYQNYGVSEPNRAEIWSVWNNLMGDPCTEIWTARPEPLVVEHPQTAAEGASSVSVRVTTGGGDPVEGALVCLYQEGAVGENVQVVGRTGSDGYAHLPIDQLDARTVELTVTKRNHVPHLGELAIDSVDRYVAFSGASLTDDGSGQSQGNGDGLLNPGETVEMAVQVRNHGGLPAVDVTATLTTSDPYVTVLSGSCSFGTIGAGETAWGDQACAFSLAASAPAGHRVEFTLVASDGSSSWSSPAPLTVEAGNLEAMQLTYSGPGGDPDPGEAGEVTILLLNGGTQAVAGAAATLVSLSPWITVTDGLAQYGPVSAGGLVDNQADPFAIAISPDCIGGHQASLRLEFQFTDGTLDTSMVQITVGSVDPFGPVGPDSYGYYAFDDLDIDYTQAPVYEWIEVDPRYGGSGTPFPLDDEGWELDDTGYLELPFTFSFYGRQYEGVSICSNGWIAMGRTSMTHYRNWNLPCAGVPGAMIAVFWDNLWIPNIGKVATWHDTANHRFVIEWSRLHEHYTYARETFELILYDPEYHPTASGDGIFVMQYYEVVNPDAVNGYATVGIQNHDRTDGITYTYWQRYAQGAAALAAGRAIRFVPVAEVEQVPTPVPEGGDSGAPAVTALAQNHPNPFNPQTVISFDLARAGYVELRIYDLTGALVKTLYSGEAAAGRKEVVWNGVDHHGKRVASGSYIYRLETGDGFTQTRKLVVVQ